MNRTKGVKFRIFLGTLLISYLLFLLTFPMTVRAETNVKNKIIYQNYGDFYENCALYAESLDRREEGAYEEYAMIFVLNTLPVNAFKDAETKAERLRIREENAKRFSGENQNFIEKNDYFRDKLVSYSKYAPFITVSYPTKEIFREELTRGEKAFKAR